MWPGGRVIFHVGGVCESMQKEQRSHVKQVPYTNRGRNEQAQLGTRSPARENTCIKSIKDSGTVANETFRRCK